MIEDPERQQACNGFLCNHCGTKMGVYKTYPEKDEIMRIRKCGKCGRIRITREKTR